MELKTKPMKNNYTDYHLIRYVYGELDIKLSHEIKEDASNDWQLRERLNSFRIVHQSLNSLKRQPSDTSVNLIMQYSRKSNKLEASV